MKNLLMDGVMPPRKEGQFITPSDITLSKNKRLKLVAGGPD